MKEETWTGRWIEEDRRMKERQEKGGEYRGRWRGKGTNFRVEEEVSEVRHGGRRRVIQMRPKTMGEVEE